MQDGELIYFVPREGLKLRNPVDPQKFIPAEGQKVRSSAFWRRRVRDGDGEAVPIRELDKEDSHGDLV